MLIDKEFLLQINILVLIMVLYFFIRYRFPHFSMHTKRRLGLLNELIFEECKEHTQEDIRKYKMRNKKILTFLFRFMFLPLLAYTIIAVIFF